jgi:hypothetical protein
VTDFPPSSACHGYSNHLHNRGDFQCRRGSLPTSCSNRLHRVGSATSPHGSILRSNPCYSRPPGGSTIDACGGCLRIFMAPSICTRLRDNLLLVLCRVVDRLRQGSSRARYAAQVCADPFLSIAYRKCSSFSDFSTGRLQSRKLFLRYWQAPVLVGDAPVWNCNGLDNHRSMVRWKEIPSVSHKIAPSSVLNSSWGKAQHFFRFPPISFQPRLPHPFRAFRERVGGKLLTAFPPGSLFQPSFGLGSAVTM